MNHTTNDSLLGRRFVVAKGAQLDTRRNERRSSQGKPPGPIDGLRGQYGSDVLKPGDAICADDLEGGAGELARLVQLGMVVEDERSEGASGQRFPLSVAPGQSTTTRRGVIGPGEQILEHELFPAELEHLIERGVVLRIGPAPAKASKPSKSPASSSGSTPPEAA